METPCTRAPVRAIKNEEMIDALPLLTAADFQPYLGHDFRIFFTGEAATVAQLAEITVLPVHPGFERKPFSILLQTDQLKFYYPQAIYTIHHHALGSLPLFLVPLGVKGKGMQYEAVFS